MIRLIVTESAKSDISKILNYLEAEAGPATAARYSDDFREWFSALAVFPESGSPRPALGKSVRVGIIHPYLMLYEYASDAASVSTLASAARAKKGYASASSSPLARSS